MSVLTKHTIKVADEAWIAVALLHREHPDQPDFTIEKIIERATKEQIAGPIRRGLYVHVVQHCVANRPPNPGRYRMLFETSSGRRRLFRPGDPYHPQREGAKASPGPDEIPRSYSGLLIWYSAWCAAATGEALDKDPLLAMLGSGKQLWADEHSDDYVTRLREGWE